MLPDNLGEPRQQFCMMTSLSWLRGRLGSLQEPLDCLKLRPDGVLADTYSMKIDKRPNTRHDQHEPESEHHQEDEIFLKAHRVYFDQSHPNISIYALAERRPPRPRSYNQHGHWTPTGPEAFGSLLMFLQDETSAAIRVLYMGRGRRRVDITMALTRFL
jgi:hypothetical protein